MFTFLRCTSQRGRLLKVSKFTHKFVNWYLFVLCYKHAYLCTQTLGFWQSLAWYERQKIAHVFFLQQLDYYLWTIVVASWLMVELFNNTLLNLTFPLLYYYYTLFYFSFCHVLKEWCLHQAVDCIFLSTNYDSLGWPISAHDVIMKAILDTLVPRNAHSIKTIFCHNYMLLMKNVIKFWGWVTFCFLCWFLMIFIMSNSCQWACWLLS